MQSCSGTDQDLYSCDPAVNEWVSSHLQEIRKMSRQNWLNTSVEISGAIFSAFTQEQKIKFWKEKLETVKRLDWSQKEVEHINKIEEFIDNNTNLFNSVPLTDEQEDLLEAFFYKWYNYGIEVLGWKENVGIAIAGSGYTLLDKEGNLELPSGKEIMVLSSEVESCTCSTGASIFCFVSGEGTCDDADCTEGNYCGWLLLQRCDGRCSNSII